MTRARELADLLTGGQTISTADNTEQLIFKSTDADASAGPLVKMHRESGSPAAGDALGRFNFIGENNADEEVTYARIHAKANDVTDGTEDGELLLLTTVAGTNRSRMAIGPSETVFNEDSVDVNFRVESDGNANLFFVDAGNDKVGVGTNTPAAIFSALSTSGTTTDIGRFEAAVGSYTGTSLVAGNTLGAASTYNLFKCITDSDADAGGPVTQFLVRGDGNVGIGTDSPTLDSALAGLSVSSNSTLLHINDTDGACLKLSDPDTGSNRGLGITIQGQSAAISNCENGELRFGTGNAERMRLTNDGAMFLNKLSANTGTVGFEFLASNNKTALGASGGASLFVNRNSSDGIVVQIAHEGAVEGNISTSGTTVSFNGGHLSRWSRLADDSKDTNIVKGTVMTNLDKMVVWHHEAKEATLYEDGDEIPEGKKVGDEKTPAVAAYDEDNEQLNCMAVSSVEGDINVAGVFVNWDEDDDYNDMNVAMTGDMVIRIAKDTTVARGDLLMSAGDGTAKPQDDDIVRSKTIAKVTSTVKSHTYDDGTYLVPCVLMAC